MFETTLRYIRSTKNHLVYESDDLVGSIYLPKSACTTTEPPATVTLQVPELGTDEDKEL